jgi:hypothetical protein
MDVEIRTNKPLVQSSTWKFHHIWGRAHTREW